MSSNALGLHGSAGFSSMSAAERSSSNSSADGVWAVVVSQQRRIAELEHILETQAAVRDSIATEAVRRIRQCEADASAVVRAAAMGLCDRFQRELEAERAATDDAERRCFDALEQLARAERTATRSRLNAPTSVLVPTVEASRPEASLASAPRRRALMGVLAMVVHTDEQRRKVDQWIQ